jgi:hypothetical protein
LKTCRQCQNQFEVDVSDRAFYDQMAFSVDGEKIQIPDPTLCPACRRQRRLSFRNERSYYRNQCDLCKKSFIGAYSPDKSFSVYCSECWWGDGWDASNFGRDVDFNKPFFEQFKELVADVPRLGVINVNAENSDYTSYGYQNKDCYLLSTCDYNDSCYYGCFVWKSTNCVDCTSITDCQYCYECVDGDKLYQCQYCRGCVSCQDCFACVDSRNLNNCFGCVGLKNKKFCFFNEQLTEEEYKKRVAEALQDREGTLKKIGEFAKQFPKRSSFQVNCENSTGNNLKNCKNVHHCYDGYGAEDCKWGTNFPGNVHHSYDFDGGGEVEWALETIACGAPGNRIFYSGHIFNSSDVLYSSYCINNKQLFGCAGLFNKERQIFNKAYSQEGYEKLQLRLIQHMKETGEWGEFFPITISPFAYNETAAQQVFPLEKAQVLEKGWKWLEKDEVAPKVEKTIPASKLPNKISEIPEDILNWAIKCEVSGRPFKITSQEFEFYKKFDVPIPHFHPDLRHEARLAQRNPQQLWERNCDKCQKEISTSYAPERPEMVYCEECYLNEVY